MPKLIHPGGLMIRSDHPEPPTRRRPSGSIQRWGSFWTCAIALLLFAAPPSLSGVRKATSTPNATHIMVLNPDVVVVANCTIRSDNTLGEFPSASTSTGFESSTFSWSPTPLLYSGLGLDGAGTASIAATAACASGTVTGTVDEAMDFRPLGLDDYLDCTVSLDFYVRGCSQPYAFQYSSTGTATITHNGCASATGAFGTATWNALGLAPGCSNGSMPLTESVAYNGLSSRTTRTFAEAPGTVYSLATSRTVSGRIEETGGPHFFGSGRLTVVLHGSFTASLTAQGAGACHDCDGFVSVSKQPAHGSIDLLGRVFAEQLVQTTTSFTGTCGCCEYRQYLLGAITEITPPSLPPFLAFPLVWTTSPREDSGAPSGSGPCAHTTRYGYRGGGSCPSDAYSCPDRASGCCYQSRDNVTQAAPLTFGVRKIAYFSGRIRHKANAALGCTEDFEEEKATWTVCLDISPIGTVTDCAGNSLQEALRRETQSTSQVRRLGSTSELTPPWAMESGVVASSYMVGDTVVLIVAARTDSAGIDTLISRSGRLSATLTSCTALPGLPPATYQESSNAIWGKLFSFRAAPPFPDSMLVTLSGLDSTVKFMLPFAAALVGTPPTQAPTVFRTAIVRCTNPARSTVAFSLVTHTDEECRVEVRDAQGRIIARLADRRFPPGEHPLAWNGQSSSGVAVNPGIYVIAVCNTDGVVAKKVVLLR